MHTKKLVNTVTFEFSAIFISRKHHKNTLCNVLDIFILTKFEFPKTTPMQTLFDTKNVLRSFCLHFYTACNYRINTCAKFKTT